MQLKMIGWCKCGQPVINTYWFSLGLKRFKYVKFTQCCFVVYELLIIFVRKTSDT